MTIPLHPHGSVVESQHSFAVEPSSDIERSVFDRSAPYKTTFDGGQLIPFFVDEAYPGDILDVEATILARFNTLKVPVYDNAYLDTQFWAVPKRLLQANYVKLMGQQDNPGDSTDYLMPVMAASVAADLAPGSVGNYFGIGRATNTTAGLQPNALWFRAHNKIWNEQYRDQNLQTSVAIHTDDGPDPWADYTIRNRGKRKDYFTSALLAPQKGVAVTLPLGTTAPVILQGTNIQGRDVNSYPSGSPDYGQLEVDGATGYLKVGTPPGSSAFAQLGTSVISSGTSYADLSVATAATVNAVRLAFQIQRMLERDARSGTRFPEVMLAHFGVKSDDRSMQRSEYLGGSTTRLTTTPIPQTGAEGDTPLANLGAIGTFAGGKHGFIRGFTEPCVIIGYLSVRVDYTYQQGYDRMWRQRTKYDQYWPALAHIGEQPVYNSEIYAQGTSADNDVFGYQEAWAHLRYKPGRITGLLNSVETDSLDIWTFAQEFGSLPALNDTFIQENPPFDRNVQTPDEPHFTADIWVRQRATRPLPVFGVPGYIDHF